VKVSLTNYQLTQKIYNDGMKYIKRTIIPLLLLISFLPLSKVNATSLDAEIAKIKSAPPHLRVKLMNQLKMKIWKMRQAQRLRAIKRLRRSIPTSKRVVIHTVKHKEHKGDKKGHNYLSDDNTISIYPLKHRVNVINHHTVTTMAHDLGETHKHLIIDKYTTKREHSISIAQEPSINTIDNPVSQHQKSPTTIHSDTGTTKETHNTPLNILDTKPSSELSNKIVETNQNQQTDMNKQTIVVDNSIKTEQSDQVAMTNNQQEQTINTTQSSKINVDNTIKTEQSNEIAITNNQQKSDVKITQSSNTDINNKTVAVNNSAQTDAKVSNNTPSNTDTKSESYIHQENTVETQQNSTNSNIEVHEDIHMEEHTTISHTSTNQASTSQSETQSSSMRSLRRVYIPNRSRRR